jgi:hypothetical protein
MKIVDPFLRLSPQFLFALLQVSTQIYYSEVEKIVGGRGAFAPLAPFPNYAYVWIFGKCVASWSVE